MIKGFKIEIDRDYNSSLNLRNYTASSAGIQVCGESVNLVSVNKQVVSVKQKKDKEFSFTKFL